MLLSSSGTNYVLNEHEDVDQYGLFTSYLSLVIQNEIPVDLSY